MPLTETFPMFEILLGLGLFYLLGLAVLGYVCLLWSIRLTGERKKWPKWVTTTFVTCHFTLGIWATVITASVLFRRIHTDSTYAPAIAFTLFILTVAYVVVVALKQWSSILKNTEGVGGSGSESGDA